MNDFIVQAVTNIAVRHQQWQGWPTTVSDDTALAMTGIPFEHDFVLRSSEATASNSIKTPTPTPTTITNNQTQQTQAESSNSRANSGRNTELIEVDSDSSIDEFEDASDFNGDDDIFTAQASNRRIKHLSTFN